MFSISLLPRLENSSRADSRLSANKDLSLSSVCSSMSLMVESNFFSICEDTVLSTSSGMILPFLTSFVSVLEYCKPRSSRKWVPSSSEVLRSSCTFTPILDRRSSTGFNCSVLNSASILLPLVSKLLPLTSFSKSLSKKYLPPFALLFGTRSS